MLRKILAAPLLAVGLLAMSVAAATAVSATDCDRYYGGSLLGNYPGTADGHPWNHCQGWYSQGSQFTVNDLYASYFTVGTLTQGGTTFCVQAAGKFIMDTQYHGASVDYSVRLTTYSGGACTSTIYNGTNAQVNYLVAGQIQQVSTADDYSTVTSTSNYVTGGSNLSAGVGGPSTSIASVIYGSPTWAETGWGTAIPAFYRWSILVTFTPSGGTQQTIGTNTWATWVG